MARPIALFWVWRGILGTALIVAMVYLIFKLSQLVDAYRAKIKP
ncbi:MAG: hypothetical protein QXN33_03895 [Candidatus Bathyarchaeia archaeon]